MHALEFKYNSMAKSAAQIQREFRNRLKGKDPELLRAQDHEKYRRRCLKRKCRTSVPVRTADSHFIDIPHRDLELKQHDDLNQSSSLKLYPIEERIHNMYDENRAMMEQCVENRLRNTSLDENVKSSESSASYRPNAKYHIHELLKWLENVNVDDEIKFGFLKYIYGDSPDECNSDASEGERRRRETSNQAERLYSKHISIESSSSESDHEHTERTLRRESTKRIRSKTISSRRKNTDAKQRKHIIWEPLYFDDDGPDENDE